VSFDIPASLAGFRGRASTAQVTAAVLVYRAVTYLLPVPAGVIAWRHAPQLIRAQLGHVQPGAAAEPVLPDEPQDACSSGSNRHERR
jgi:hypothetical protein